MPEDEDEYLDHSFLAQMKAMVNVVPEPEADTDQQSAVAQQPETTAQQQPPPSTRDYPNVLQYSDLMTSVPLVQQHELASTRHAELNQLQRNAARDNERSELFKKIDALNEEIYIHTFGNLKIVPGNAFFALAQYGSTLVRLRNKIVEAIHVPTRGARAQPQLLHDLHVEMGKMLDGLLVQRQNKTDATLQSMDAMTAAIGLQDLVNGDVEPTVITDLFRRKRAGPPEFWQPEKPVDRRLIDDRYVAVRMPDYSGRVVFAVVGDERRMKELLASRHLPFYMCVLGVAETLEWQDQQRKMAQFMKQPQPNYDLIDPLRGVCNDRMPPMDGQQPDEVVGTPYVEMPLNDGTDRFVYALDGTEGAMFAMLQRNPDLVHAALEITAQIAAGQPDVELLDPVRMCAERELNDDRYVAVLLQDGSNRVVYAARGTEEEFERHCHDQRRNVAFNKCLAEASDRLRTLTRLRAIKNLPIGAEPVVDTMADCVRQFSADGTVLEDEDAPSFEMFDDDDGQHEQRVHIGFNVDQGQPVRLENIHGYGGNVDIRMEYGYRRQAVPNSRSAFYYSPDDETTVQRIVAENDVPAMHARLWWSLELANQLDAAIKLVLNGRVYKPAKCTPLAEIEGLLVQMPRPDRDEMVHMLLLYSKIKHPAGFLAEKEKPGERLDEFVDQPIRYGLIYGYGGEMDIRQVCGYIPIRVEGTNAVVYCDSKQTEATLQRLAGDRRSVALVLMWSQQLAVDLDRSVQKSLRGGRFEFRAANIDNMTLARDRLIEMGGFERLVAEASHKYRAGERMLLDDGMGTKQPAPRRSEGAALAVKGRMDTAGVYLALPPRPDWEQARLRAHLEEVERRLQVWCTAYFIEGSPLSLYGCFERENEYSDKT